MKKMTCSQLQNQIIHTYQSEIIFKFVQDTPIAYCYVKEKIICFPLQDMLNPNNRTVFDLLHEIGHIKTNTNNMKRCEEEYYATQWAIEQCMILGQEIDDRDMEIYQDYIWGWRETGLKLKAKSMPTKQQLKLEW